MLSTWATVLGTVVFLDLVLASNTSCPTWFHYNARHECECGNIRGNLQLYCHQKERRVEIADYVCATYSQHESLYYAGACLLKHSSNNGSRGRILSELPTDGNKLNDVICGPYKRKGVLCGRCMAGYGPAVYTLDMKCANCSKLSAGFAVSLCLLLEFIPITLFFICVVSFRINITAGPLLGYVLFCQLYVFEVERDVYIYSYILSHVSTPLQVLSYISLTLSGVWILQFFRFVIPSFCISEQLTDIHIHMLRLVTSIYPIVLVIITCILLELQARRCRIFHIIFKPFNTILRKLKIASLTTDMVVRTFATFVLLSASSLTYNMTITFTHVPVYRNTDGEVVRNVLYYDPSISWLSYKHIPYMVIALVLFTFFVFVPSLLLCVYPTRIYRSLSKCISVRKQLAITAFTETLNNCFKDGLNDTRDFRALAGFIAVGGAMYALVNFFVWKFVYLLFGYSLHYVSGFFLFILSFVISYVRPCKLTIANFSLSYHCIVTGILSIAVGLWKQDLLTTTITLEKTFILIPLAAHILVIAWAGYSTTVWVMSHCGYQFNRTDCKVALADLANYVKQRFRNRCSGYQVIPH